MTHEELIAWRNKQAEDAIRGGAESFLGIPDAWFEKPRWLCHNGHVSSWYVGSETRGEICPVCRNWVVLVSPDINRDFKPDELVTLLTT